MLKNNSSFIFPDWPAPKNVRAYQTTRLNGNLATHVNDDPENVHNNRQKLERELDLPSSPFWLEQVHSNSVQIIEGGGRPEEVRRGDASLTRENGLVCVVMTADCLPILLCSRNGNEIAALHAGWRGLLNGVIDNTVSLLKSEPSDIMAWLGPAIGPEVFEVGQEIRVDFLNNNAENETAFSEHVPNRWFADLYELARIRLRQLGIHEIYGGDFCTYRDSDLFYSYRREKGKTGRMASLIWKL